MYISKLVLNNFRNYSHLETSFDLNRIFITGPNGNGKTNIIEAIYYLTLGRSFRKVDDVGLIKHNQNEANIYLEYHSMIDNSNHSLSCIINPKYKVFAKDGEKVKSLSSILGSLIAVYYAPSLVFYFQEEPEMRRKSLDETCSQLSQKYLFAISRYKKLLKQRNIALQQDYDKDVLNVLRNELITLSYRIVSDRKALINNLSKKSNRYYKLLFGEDRNLTLKYKTLCPIDDDQETFTKNMLSLFDKNQSVESIKKVTVIGPHRDDLLGYLDGSFVANYGSQGENRLASLSLKLSTLDLITEKYKERPLLILDDITSDLDDKRCENLLSCINQKDQQLFVTGTRIPNNFKNYEIYQSHNSTLTKEEITDE